MKVDVLTSALVLVPLSRVAMVSRGYSATSATHEKNAEASAVMAM